MGLQCAETNETRSREEILGVHDIFGVEDWNGLSQQSDPELSFQSDDVEPPIHVSAEHQEGVLLLEDINKVRVFDGQIPGVNTGITPNFIVYDK